MQHRKRTNTRTSKHIRCSKAQEKVSVTNDPRFGRWFCSTIYSVIPINESHLWIVMFSNSLQSFVTLGVWYCHQTLMEISPEQFNTIHWVVQGLLELWGKHHKGRLNCYLLTLNLISIQLLWSCSHKRLAVADIFFHW